MAITLRKGDPDDAYQIAELLHVASGGMSDFLLHDILPNCNTLDLITLGVTDKTSSISYSRTFVADRNKKIQGIINFYPSNKHRIPEIMRTFIPQDRIEHLAPFFAHIVPDSIYIHALAVKENSGYNSLATMLILKVIAHAKQQGLNKLSAHVWANNKRVLTTLLKKGFEVHTQINFAEHPLLPEHTDMFLLSYDIK